MAIPLSLSMLPSDIRKLIVREYLDGPSKMLMRSVSRYFRDLIVLPPGRCSFGVDICAVAARQGWLSVLQFALNHGAQLSVHLCAEAAAGGELLALLQILPLGCSDMYVRSSLWSPRVAAVGTSGGLPLGWSLSLSSGGPRRALSCPAVGSG